MTHKSWLFMVHESNPHFDQIIPISFFVCQCMGCTLQHSFIPIGDISSLASIELKYLYRKSGDKSWACSLSINQVQVTIFRAMHLVLKLRRALELRSFLFSRGKINFRSCQPIALAGSSCNTIQTVSSSANHLC